MNPNPKPATVTPVPSNNARSEGQQKFRRSTKQVSVPRELYEEIRVLSDRVGIDPAAVLVGAARLVIKRLKAGAALALTQDGVTLVEVGKANP